MSRIHLGCGTVYLDGWLNIDLPGPKTFLAKDRPDLVTKLRTTDDQYYARHADKNQDALRSGPLDQEMVCDNFGSFFSIPSPYWDADEILCRHSFEHLSLTEARKALYEIDAVMKPNGVLRIDVPDHDETLRLYRDTGDDFYRRHLLGPRRNDYGYHMMSYDRDRLRNIVEEYGFVFVSEEPNIHFYPAFCLRFVKPGVRAPRDYAWPPPYEVPESWKILEIGPGAYPLPRANVYLDNDQHNLMPLLNQGRDVIVGDIETGLPDIANKTYDFVWMSHVMEHVSDPMAAARTLSRIGKRGIIIMPSAIKEGLFGGQEEADHKWLVLWSPSGREPIFVKHNPEVMAKIKNTEIEKSTSRLWRTGPNRIEEARFLRKWFYQNEAALDVVVHWNGELKVQVVQ